jgi:hypothetical protein
MSESPTAEVLSVIQQYKDFYGKPPAEIFAAPDTIKSLGTLDEAALAEVAGVKLTVCVICPPGAYYALNEEDAEQVRQQERAAIEEARERMVL